MVSTPPPPHHSPSAHLQQWQLHLCLGDALFSDGEIARVEFDADEIPSRLDARHACCAAAHAMWYNTYMITKTCEMCGKPFDVRNYRVNTARFCSRSCGGKWQAQTYLNKKPKTYMLGNKLRKGLRPTNAFTSEQVRGENNPKWVEPVELTCLQCGKLFYLKPWIVRQSNRLFCTAKCRYTWNKGENHWHYLGGYDGYRGRSWLTQRALAVTRDNGTCQACGKIEGDSIPVHHIRPYRTFETEQEANDLENLICLCQSCHMKREYAEALPFAFAHIQSQNT